VDARLTGPADPQGRRLALIVAYAGGRWHGFQRQPGVETVQGELERALAEVVGGPVRVRGAGRTDAGVHASGQVVDFTLPQEVGLPLERLPRALAAHLPPDIVTWSAHAVPSEFHARKSALGKRYRFLIWRASQPSPFLRAYALHRHGHLDVPAMRAAARALVGRHDFSALAGAGRPVDDATRTVVDCRVLEAGHLLAVEVEADGFLYRMVRAITGTLLEVGRGAMPAEAVPALLAGGRRGDAGPSLPPQGLCLLWVRYPPAAGLPAPDARAAWPPAPGDADLQGSANGGDGGWVPRDGRWW
jgi:tRNA pseudouridine38-40 synthase